MLSPDIGDRIDVWFSCGAASAVAAKLTLDKYAHCRVRILNNPIAEEDYDNRRFLEDVEKWLGVPILTVVNPKYPEARCEQVWDSAKFMSGPKGAPCTRALKREARQYWESLHPSEWMVLGFTAEEQVRYDNFVLSERGSVLPVLIDAGLTKDDCAGVLTAAGIALPRVYAEGYPNANCIGCVKATSPTYWNHVRRTRPETFARRAEQSRRIGARLVRYKGERIFLDELPPDATGKPMKSLKIPECGIFCEEKIIK